MSMLLLLLKNGQWDVCTGRRCSAKETVFGSLSNFCCPWRRSGMNRIGHPDWVKLCVELKCAKPKYEIFLCYNHSKTAPVHLLSVNLTICLAKQNFYFRYRTFTSFTPFHIWITLFRMCSYNDIPNVDLSLESEPVAILSSSDDEGEK